MWKHLESTSRTTMKEGLKLVLLLFDRAEKQNKKTFLIHFLLHWGCAADSRALTPTIRNGDVVVEQQQAVLRTAQGHLEQQ